MTMRVWDPFRDLVRLSDAMNQLFADSWVRPTRWVGGEFYLPIDLVESGEGYMLKAAVPGFSPEDINVNLEGNTLTIHAEYKGEQPKDGVTYLLKERLVVGSFTRTITLPTKIDYDHVEAHFENGELVLTLPKAEEVKPRQIQINVGTQPQLGEGSQHEIAA
jgi:HSP20 family protein